MDGSVALVTSLGRAKLSLGLGLRLGLRYVEDPRSIKVPMHMRDSGWGIPVFLSSSPFHRILLFHCTKIQTPDRNMHTDATNQIK